MRKLLQFILEIIGFIAALVISFASPVFLMLFIGDIINEGLGFWDSLLVNTWDCLVVEFTAFIVMAITLFISNYLEKKHEDYQ